MLLNLTADLDTVKLGSVALPPGGEKKVKASACGGRRFFLPVKLYLKT